MTAPLAAPEGRFALALNADEPTLTWDPDWTLIDQDYPSLVTSYAIDRGRQYELDRTDGGRATVRIADHQGILDPTNTHGPYYGLIEPLLQAAICRWNPVADEWQWRFRGFVEEMDYAFDPSQRVNMLTISLVDIFELVGAVEMLPGQFGADPVASGVPASAGQVFFLEEHADDRIIGVLTSCNIPDDFYVVFSLNVVVHQWPYSPGEAAMTAVQEAADAEFPGVSNVFPDRFGRLAVHGRLAKFDPVGVASGAATGQWDFHEWQAGDGAAVLGNPAQFAHIRQFAFNRGLAKIINSALATPVDIADAAVAGQLVQDTTSIGLRGIRSWSSQNLLTKEGLLDSSDDLTETKRFASYYVNNYAEARDRVTQIGFRSMGLGQPGASENWRLLSTVDIGDTIEITIASPGGGGFNAEPYFVEGVHETCNPSGHDYDDVTVTLDVSPRAYFTDNPFPLVKDRKPILHHRDHEPGGADPIRGLPDAPPGGDTLDAVIAGLAPAGWWKLDESSGTVAHDSSGNGLDLSVDTYGVAPTWGQPAGPPGTPAADFETGSGGIGGTAGRVARSWAAAVTGDFTVGIFVSRNNTNTTAFIGQGNPSRTGGGGWLLAVNNPSTSPGNHTYFAAKGAGGANSDNPLAASTWSFVAGVHSGTTWTLYVNGLAQSAPVIGAFTAAPSPYKLWIGQDGFSPSVSVDVPQFVGSYAFLIPSALSGAELLAIYNSAVVPGGSDVGKALLATGLGGSSWDFPLEVTF